MAGGAKRAGLAGECQKEVYRISDKIVRTTNITQSAIVKNGYTTVIAAAVFLF